MNGKNLAHGKHSSTCKVSSNLGALFGIPIDNKVAQGGTVAGSKIQKTEHFWALPMNSERPLASSSSFFKMSRPYALFLDHWPMARCHRCGGSCPSSPCLVAPPNEVGRIQLQVLPSCKPRSSQRQNAAANLCSFRSGSGEVCKTPKSFT